MAVTRRQTAAADASPASATFGATPVEGNLLVAISNERSGIGTAGMSINGTGWEKQVGHDNEIGDASFRHSLTAWWKLAGAAEPTNVQVSGGTNRLVIQEFEGDASEVFAFVEAVSNGSGTSSNVTSLNTGTTSSLAAGGKLLVGAYGQRNNDPDTASVAWTTINLADGLISGGAVNFGRTLASAFAEDATGGTKTTTATPNQTSNTGIIAGLLVFSTEAGGEEPAAVRLLASLGVGS